MRAHFTATTLSTLYLTSTPQKTTTMNSPITIQAVYASPLPAPSDNKTFAIATGPADGTDTKHLAAVREAVSQLQAQVNAYLTERMEEEKNLGKVVEEGDVEASYGEEVVEEV